MYWNLEGVGSSYFEIFSNTIRVVKTIGSEKEHLGYRRELKIRKEVAELGRGNISGRRCLRKRGCSWFLPPPGGPHTGMRVVSSTSLKNNLFLS